MRNRRVIVLAMILALSLTMLVACNVSPIEFGAEYKQVMYDVEIGEFAHTGNSIIIGNDYTYQEKYKTGIDDYSTFNGKYVSTDPNKLLFTRLESSSFSKFKNTYKTQLKSLGYSSSEIKELIMPSVTDKSELFIYKDYIFKSSSIIAAKIATDDYRLTELDGMYRFNGLLDEHDSVMLVKLNEIFLEGTDEFGEKIYTEKIGECNLENDFITITPLVATGGGDINKAMKYLIADIEFPVKYSESVDENGVYDENNVITYYDNVHVKVIVSTFYTLKETINREI